MAAEPMPTAAEDEDPVACTVVCEDDYVEPAPVPPTVVPSLSGMDTPKMADTAIAGIGLFGSIGLLGLLESMSGVPLFVPPMMASGIIFFAAPSPPSPQGFLSGTLCSATISFATLAALSGPRTVVWLEAGRNRQAADEFWPRAEERFNVEVVPRKELDPIYQLTDVDVWRLRLRAE